MMSHLGHGDVTYVVMETFNTLALSVFTGMPMLPKFITLDELVVVVVDVVVHGGTCT